MQEEKDFHQKGAEARLKQLIESKRTKKRFDDIYNRLSRHVKRIRA